VRCGALSGRKLADVARRVLRLPPLVLISGLALLATAAPSPAEVRLTTAPDLEPPFRPAAADYAARCVPGKPLRVAVEAPAGARVAVAGHPEREGSFVTAVRRRAGAGLTVRVRERSGAVRYYHVRCLPPDFPKWQFERRSQPQAQWYVTAPGRPGAHSYVTILDANGAPVWWWRSRVTRYLLWDAKLAGDGSLLWAHNYVGQHFGVHAEGGYEQRALDGRRLRFVRASGNPTDVHDLQRLPDGHFYAIAYRPREHVDLSPYGGPSDARVFDGEIQELTPSGKVVWRWNSRGHVDPGETGDTWWYNEAGGKPPPAERGWDLLHVNSVEPDGDGVIVSARHLDAVLRIDRATGEIDWKLGGSFVPGKSLTVVGMPPGEPVFQGQHDARLLGDGTLAVYDNRSYLGPPVADRFRIDPVTRTATRIGHATDPGIRESNWGGSARRLAAGNWVIDWGGAGLTTEQTADGGLVTALRFPGYDNYRTQPLPPGRLTAAELRRGMNAIARARYARR
jgi:Arylsulfotransferase (ASST)